MAQLRLALAQVDLRVGDLDANSRLVIDATTEAAAAGAHLIAFPEMTLTGYPPEDLVFRQSFRHASLMALDQVAADLGAAGLGEVGVIIGYLGDDGGPRNACAFCLGGQVVATY